jgi:nucleotide-binding universal stress UspA family protein
MRWLVDLDPARQIDGNIELCRWIDARAADSKCEFVGVVITEPDDPRVDEEILHEVQTILRRHEAQHLVTPSVVVRADEPPSALQRLAEDRGRFTGIIVGRRARKDARSIVRLGRIARAMVRASTLPVLVTPPDLRHGEVPSGPVLATTGHRDIDVEMAQHAHDVARALDLPFEVLHVDVRLTPLVAAHAAETERVCGGTFGFTAVRDWCQAHDLHPARIEARATPELVSAVVVYARERNANMVAVGIRDESWLVRLLLPSCAPRPAADLDRPRSVVPVGR